MEPALLIMAAGLGSRYTGGIKQLETVGPNGEIIMDYSIHDAIEAGFRTIVFVIRHDIEQAFREAIGRRIEAVGARLNVKIRYAWQEIRDIPGHFPEGRVKPWGTGQAVLAAKEYLKEPFAVINADDYYGKNAFKAIYRYLTNEKEACCMAGFTLRNTLSEHGSVTRGLCQVAPDGRLLRVIETFDMHRDGDRVVSPNGAVDPDMPVSMNIWGLRPGFVEELDRGFRDFFHRIEAGELDPLTAEYLLPQIINRLLGEGRIAVQVLPTGDHWFGVTYKEDREAVAANFRRLTDEGVYAPDLFSDL